MSVAMSDDDRDIDVESDEEDSDSTRPSFSRHASGSQYYSQAEKRAHHNALERKRRDHIKDSFSSLRDAVPALNGEKASRAQILKKAAEYIAFMKKKIHSNQQDIDDIKKQNTALEAQIKLLEKYKSASGSNQFKIEHMEDRGTESDTSDIDERCHFRRSRKTRSPPVC